MARSRELEGGEAQQESCHPNSSCPPPQTLLPESMMQSLLPGSGFQKQLLAAQGQLQSSTAQLQVELLQSQTKLSELEAQVRAAGQRGEDHSLPRGKWLEASPGGRKGGLDAQARSLVAEEPMDSSTPRCGSWSWSVASTGCCWRVCSSGTRQTWSSLRTRTGTHWLQPRGLPELRFPSSWTQDLPLRSAWPSRRVFC